MGGSRLLIGARGGGAVEVSEVHVTLGPVTLKRSFKLTTGGSFSFKSYARTGGWRAIFGSALRACETRG